MEKNEIGSHEIEFLHEIDLKWIVVSNMKGNIYNLQKKMQENAYVISYLTQKNPNHKKSLINLTTVILRKSDREKIL